MKKTKRKSKWTWHAAKIARMIKPFRCGHCGGKCDFDIMVAVANKPDRIQRMWVGVDPAWEEKE